MILQQIRLLLMDVVYRRYIRCSKNLTLLGTILAIFLFFIFIFYTFGIRSRIQDPVYNTLLLGNMQNIPNKVLDTYSSGADSTNMSCTYFNCFNVYHCGSRGSKLLIYVYPPTIYIDSYDKSETGHVSKEFTQILDTIISSKYYTPNPHEACIFVPSVDVLNQNRIKSKKVSQVLNSLEFWNGGENHLIFNMIPGNFPDYTATLDVSVGKAMIAGAGFSTFMHRENFDINLPVFSPLTTNLHKREKQFRTWFAVTSQINFNNAVTQDILQLRNAFPKDFIILSSCPHHNYTKINLRCIAQNVYKYPEVLQKALFCLIMHTSRFGQPVLLESLATGCIPVIISDSPLMPFQEVIDWNRIAIFIREVDLLTVMEILTKVSNDKIVTLQNHGAWIYKRYFQSIKKITETTLEIITDRVFPYLARDYMFWNVPSNMSYETPLFLPITAQKTRGFTAVILTYDRLELLFSLMEHIVKVPSLSKILVIWNNQQKSPPISGWPRLSKPWKVIQTKENKLSNRFYPYEEIETEAILSLDDDITMLTVDEVEFAYEVWREFPDRLVGFPSRTHTWDNETFCWKYESEWTNSLSMVLTGAAFYHKHWNYMYTTKMPGDIKELVDKHMNCEDIAMNFLISNVTGKAPIKVTPKKKFRCPECTNTEMLSADLTHMVERTQCINKFSRIYGSMPLKFAEFRADPVLFKDMFPEKLKRFNDIGNL